MKTYTISFEITVPDDASHPLEWIPEAVQDGMRDDETTAYWHAVEQHIYD
jgi:hypothetical protein